MGVQAADINSKDPRTPDARANPQAASDNPAAKKVAQVKTADWEKVSDDDGIEVFKKEIPGNPMIAFKGQGVVAAPMLKVISILSDVPRGVEWIDSLKDTLLVKKNSETNWIAYTHIGTPMVMKDRDFVIQSNVEIQPDKSIVMSLKSVDDPTAPTSDYVRGEVIDSSYILTAREGGKSTFVVTEIHADPKGSTAKWIVNMFQQNWPRNTLSSLRKQVMKTDIVENPYFKKELATDSDR